MNYLRLKLMLPISLKCLLIFSIVGSLACGGGGGGDSTGGSVAVSTDSCSVLGLSPKVVNGTACNNPGASPVVRIGLLFGDGTANFFCTGSLISPREVVTAAHCFGSIGANSISSLAAISGDIGALTAVAATDLFIHPNYVPSQGLGSRAFNDVAILRLSADLPNPVLPVNLTSPPAVGAVLQVYGYGQTVVGNTTVDSISADALDFSDLVSGEMRLTDISDDHYFVTFDGNGSNVCFGDSGGPLVHVVNGVATSLGVVADGTRLDCRPGDVTTFTSFRSPVVLAWLASVAPGGAAL